LSLTSPKTPPPELANLVRIRQLRDSAYEWVQLLQFRQNAEEYLAAAQAEGARPIAKFLLAYEAIHSLCIGYVYAHGLLPAEGPGHRETVLKLALQQLGGTPEEFAELDQAHRTRNEKTYRLPAPPVSGKTADELLALAQRLTSLAKAKLPDWFEDR